MPDTSGPPSGQPFAFFDPATQSWRTSPVTGDEDSCPYSETVPRTGSLSGGRLYAHPTSEPPTDESDSFLLLPTTQARDFKGISFSSHDMSRLINVVIELSGYWTSPGGIMDRRSGDGKRF